MRRRVSFLCGSFLGAFFSVSLCLAFNGPLRISPSNPRYLTDNSGKAILLTGAHTWRNFQALGSDNFNFTAYLNFLTSNNLNFMRLWIWEQSRGPAGYPSNYTVSPLPFSKPSKYDLTQLNQTFFDRMRQHIIDAGNHGIYVSIQLFNGWSVGSKNGEASPWPNHPMNSNNNINGINGDPSGDGNGYEIETLSISAVIALQDAYVRKVIDTVNDLDNVLYEICNESEGNSNSVAWQNHMVDLIHTYEAGKPKQHVVGFTIPYPNGDNRWLFNSNADWIAPNQTDSSGYDYMSNPRPNSGSKVIISDTDHLWGLGGDRAWAWKSFTRGLNFSYMDCYVEDSLGCPISQSDPTRLSLLANMGYTRQYAEKMNLLNMVPHGELASTSYCLANPASSGAEYLAYQPSSGAFTVNLSAVPASTSLSVEWLNPRTGAKSAGSPVSGGATRTFTPPFSGDAIIYLEAIPPAAPTNLRILR